MSIYPSDISREQLKKIQYILEGARKKTCFSFLSVV